MVDRMFEVALGSQSRSPLLRLFLLQYIRYYRLNSYVELLQLKSLEQVMSVHAAPSVTLLSRHLEVMLAVLLPSP